MKFSLVMSTLNRFKEVDIFLKSLKEQTYKNFELIIVDQNKNERLRDIIKKYSSDMKIIYIDSSVKGLSKGRNIGLEYISGEIIGFPDDDCKYPKETLYKVNDLFEKDYCVDGITGISKGFNGDLSDSGFDKKNGYLDKKNCWKRAISYTIFLKRKVVNSIGKFDESLGVGSKTPWGSGEETDYLLRAINKNYKIFYNQNIYIYHPIKNKIDYNKTFKYAMGMGRVLKKHNYSKIIVFKYLIRSMGGMAYSALFFNRKKIKNYWYMFLGRLLGWIAPY